MAKNKIFILNSDFFSNKAGFGGAIYIYNYDVKNFLVIKFDKNIFINNEAIQGGAIFFSNISS